MSIEKVANALASAKTLVYDAETNGLDWRKCHVVGHVLTFGPKVEDTFYLPVRHGGGGNLDPEQVERMLREGVAANRDLRVVGHNLAFDLHFAANHDLRFSGPLECTMVNAALIDENAGAYSLEACARRAGVQEKRGDALYSHMATLFGGEANRNQMANFWRLAGTDPIGVDYAIGDGVTTWQLWEHQQSELDEQELRTVWGVECRVIRTLHRMERHGVRIDLERLADLERDISNRLVAATGKLPSGFNVRSTPSLTKLFRDAGFVDYPLTEKGNPSFTEQWLKSNELGQFILAVRKLTNLQNSFIVPLRDRHLHNGRVHPTFNQLKADEYGTVTGRLSCSNPNAQQVPKRDKLLAPLFRSVFVPDENTLWSSNDYGQQEFVVFTEYTKAPRLMAGYNQDPQVDIHTTVAEMLGVERDPTAKRMNLGMVYGMGVKKLAASLGIPLERASEYRTRYDEMIPEARTFLKEAERRAKYRGWVKTKLGRRRRFPDSRYAHKAGNSIIQGSSADITKLKMVEIDEYFASKGDQCKLILQVHDELDWVVPEGCEDQNQEALRIMQSFTENDLISLSVRLRVDHSTGKNWAEAVF